MAHLDSPGAERFGARVVATPGTLAQMHKNVAARPYLWDKIYAGMIPPSPVTAVTVTDSAFTLEGHDLVMVDVGYTASADPAFFTSRTSAGGGDSICNGVHMYMVAHEAVGSLGHGETRSTRLKR